MVFSSIGFIFVFLSATLLCYFIVPKKLRNLVLLISSLIFYYIGEQHLIWLMIASSLTDYFCSLGIEHFREKKGMTRLFLCISLVINLSLLGYFKYADLFINSFNALTGAAVPLLKIALPIGISFYTFQTMSYTIDVYRGEVRAEKNFINFAAYVTLFPQLVAGPIVRYETVAAELKERSVTLEKFSLGISRFCIGLGKKVLIANSLAALVKLYAEAEGGHTVLMAWAYAIALPLQIYFDFSGYSDMAIGLGHMFGFTFLENFNYPFIAKTATDFWRRWHMSLGTWFRDYVYFPMGGNRVKPARHIFNLLVVWFITGMWHGASYNFILWGGYYGVLIILEKYIYGKYLEKSHVISRIYFFFVTVFGFIIFDTENLSQVFSKFGELFGVGTTALYDTSSLFYVSSYLFTLVIALVCAMPIGKKLWAKLCEKEKSRAVFTCLGYAACFAMLIVSTAYLIDGSYNPFLYFRF
mgnify:CR=1 FL=1